MLLGQMMQRPLLISDIITYAAEVFPDAEVVTSTVEGTRHRYSYRTALRRISQLAHGLIALGVRPGDRVATLAWNTYRHLEVYYAVSGIGAVCHTINPRLPVTQIDYILRHAEDVLLLHDVDLRTLVRQLPQVVGGQMGVVALCDQARLAVDFEAGEAMAYESVLAGQPDHFDWPLFDENTAAGICYTSGTTGNPKGALYSHRSSVLHAIGTIVGRCAEFPRGGRTLPVVPMFHVNAWGLPYSAPLSGQSLIMPGPRLDGDSLFKLMDEETVFSAWGVPTVWQVLLDAMDRHGRKPRGLGEVVVGGSAASGQLIDRFEEEYGVDVRHAWGMTEMSPVGTSGALGPHLDGTARDERTRAKLRQGHRIFGVELDIMDEEGNRLPHDGVTAGELLVRGNTVISGYFRNPEADATAFDKQGWFRTGDRARISADGWLILVDRVKDLIKSGGEWISSADLEEAAMRYPGMVACAAIGVPDEKWGERPVLVCKLKAGHPLDERALRELMGQSLAKWQLPDRIVVRESLPMTATGKISKKDLRSELAAM